VAHVKVAYLKKGGYLHGPRPDIGAGIVQQHLHRDTIKSRRRRAALYSANRLRFAAKYLRIIASDRQSKYNLFPIPVLISTAFLCALQ